MKRKIAFLPPPQMPGTMRQFQLQQQQPFQQKYPPQPFANTQQPPSGTKIYRQLFANSIILNIHLLTFSQNKHNICLKDISRKISQLMFLQLLFEEYFCFN